MGRSRRKTPIVPMTKGADSEQQDKRRWNRQHRHQNRQRLAQGRPLVLLREASKIYTGAKDGKQYLHGAGWEEARRKKEATM